MMSFALGLITVWVSACRHYFHSDNSPIGPVSTQYISWAGSIPFLSALLGLFVWGNLSERLGRKPTGFILGLPFTIMYILLCVSHNQTVVLVARFIGGFANVGCIMCVTLYVKEIASAEMRVRLTNIMAVSIVLGSLYVISVSSIVTYEVLHQLLLVWCIVYLILFSFLPETPVYHIRNGNYEKARQSLEWLRQTKDETLISREIEALKETFINKTGIKFLDVFRNKYYFKTMLISVFLQITINNVTGFSVFLTYSSEIFEQLLQDENVAWYNIIFTALQIIGGLITFLVADKFGRRTYIVSSNIILSALLLTLALCQYLEIQVFKMFTVLVMFVFILIFFAISFPIMYIYFNEIISSESSNHIFTIMMLGKNLGWFVSTKMYYTIKEHIGLEGVFFLFSLGSLLLALITLTFPESKNKTLKKLNEELVR